LGAGRAEIIRQFMIECLMLSAAGALVGLLLAYACMPLIRSLGAERIPRLHHVAIDLPVLLFTAAVAVTSGLIFGLIPAFRFSSANLAPVLRAGGRTSMSDSGRLRNILVVGEVALALVVVVGASLLVRSLNQLLQVNPGFRTDHLLVGHIALPTNHYKPVDVLNFYSRLLPKIAAIPGVVAVSTAKALPLASPVTQTRFLVQGVPLPEPGRYPVTAITTVDPEFFKTMGIPILRGRTFNREEVGKENDERCIINAALARSFFGSQDPIGRSLLLDLAAARPEQFRIVGVVGDTLIAGLDVAPQPVIYFASYVSKEMLVVRTSTDPMVVAPLIQRQVAAADPEQPLSGIRTMDEALTTSLSRRGFAAVLLVTFAGLGLILAALGLYGVVSYSVAQRTHEIGVRMALGAEPRSVFQMILAQGMWVTGLGLIVGSIAAAGATRIMSSLLFGIGPSDPLSYVAGCVLLFAVTGLACFFPAYRATRVDPLVSLRYE
jgi:putative ABC transport system permease protein